MPKKWVFISDLVPPDPYYEQIKHTPEAKACRRQFYNAICRGIAERETELAAMKGNESNYNDMKDGLYSMKMSRDRVGSEL